MATTPEGKVKLSVKKFLAARAAWFCMPATGGFGKSGVPDFLVCYCGQFIGIETKAPGARRNTTTMQDREIHGIHAAGGRAVVVDDVSQLVAIFDQIRLDILDARSQVTP